MDHLYTVVIAGGSGTRFWPASRRERPKQLLALGGDPAESLLAATVRRIRPLCPPDRILVATGAHLIHATRAVLPDVPAVNVLAEPVARNTAPCIGWASRVAARRDPDAVVMVLPADHTVTDEPAFRDVLAEAIAVAQTGRITTVGLEPTRAETGYGYIEVGPSISGRAHDVARFVEKPDRERAEAFLAGGRHLWNGGMFFFRARDLDAQIRAHLPALAHGLDLLDAAATRGDEADELARVFPSLPSISIDHGVMEHAAPLAVVRGAFGWSDVGSWESAWELAPHDAHGNAGAKGEVMIDATGNLVRDLGTGNKPVIALVGVHDLVVVRTDDAILVMPRSRAQDVRLVVEELGRHGDPRR
jgi:mannose-1-phosphate guanylyltransferase